LLQRSATGCGPKITVYSPEGARSPSIAATALPAASPPASSVKCSSRVQMDHPEPLASRASTMPVAEADMNAQSSAWGSGMALEAIATRDWRIVTSPPRMSPSRLSPASSGTRSPRSMYSLAFLPISVPSLTAARRMSPVA